MEPKETGHSFFKDTLFELVQDLKSPWFVHGARSEFVSRSFFVAGCGTPRPRGEPSGSGESVAFLSWRSPFVVLIDPLGLDT